MKKVLYVLNDCMRKFSYERTEGLSRAFRAMEEPVDLYIVRSDGYSEFAPEHNCGEYNIFRLPDYSDFDGVLSRPHPHQGRVLRGEHPHHGAAQLFRGQAPQVHEPAALRHLAQGRAHGPLQPPGLPRSGLSPLPGAQPQGRQARHPVSGHGPSQAGQRHLRPCRGRRRDPEEAKTLDQYVELADSLMYAEKNAKRAGERARA